MLTNCRPDQRTFHGTAGPNDILKIDSYTYADLAEAVDLMHEGGAKPPQQPNAGLSEPRHACLELCAHALYSALSPEWYEAECAASDRSL